MERHRLRMIYAIPAVLGLLTASSVAEGTADAEAWVQQVEQRIDGWELLQRNMEYVHETIPAIGMPVSRVLGWFDQEHTEEVFREYPLKVENTYEFTARIYREVFYYTPEGSVVCCESYVPGAEGSLELHEGFLLAADGRFMRYGTPGVAAPASSEEEIRARRLMARGVELRGLFESSPVPVPLVFGEGI